MKTVLLLHTSLNGRDSLSSVLALEYIDTLREEYPALEVIERDFSVDPVPHLTAERFAAFSAAAGDLSPEQARVLEESDALIGELKAADEVIVALPMYNFAIPSTLKAYFDHVARAGVTFRYTADGPKGMLSAASVTVVATRGGRYEGTPLDTQSDYVRNFFAFLGIADSRFIYAEGTAMGDEARDASVKAAREQIRAPHAA